MKSEFPKRKINKPLKTQRQGPTQTCSKWMEKQKQVCFESA